MTMNPVIIDQLHAFQQSKLLTGILARSIHNYLIENFLYPTEQKGNLKKSRGMIDQLLIDKMILKNAKRRKRNLNTVWIAYQKGI